MEEAALDMTLTAFVLARRFNDTDLNLYGPRPPRTMEEQP
ncbi:hypothetical protein GZL_08438 [Streptomyces sp. 769]|nr:hypothetical protein GZL_08438 [Streptomyces sp. 769]